MNKKGKVVHTCFSYTFLGCFKWTELRPNGHLMTLCAEKGLGFAVLY